MHVLHTVPVHIPVPYISNGHVTGSGTAATDTLCNGIKSGIKRYRVSIAFVLGIAFVPGQYRFCTGSMLFLYTITVAFTYCVCTSLHKLMSCMHT